MIEHEWDPVLETLPEIDSPFGNARGWVLDGPNHQVVFFKNDGEIDVPEHVNCNQWGVVLEGEMELIVAGESTVYRKGDTYFIPAGVPHIAKATGQGMAIDFFDEGGRHKVKGS